jgi:hypothetical protein
VSGSGLPAQHDQVSLCTAGSTCWQLCCVDPAHHTTYPHCLCRCCRPPPCPAASLAKALLPPSRTRRTCSSPPRATWRLAAQVTAGPSGWTSLLTCTAPSWAPSLQRWRTRCGATGPTWPRRSAWCAPAAGGARAPARRCLWRLRWSLCGRPTACVMARMQRWVRGGAGGCALWLLRLGR